MNLTCTICTDFISLSSDACAIRCGHIFHVHCVFNWIERNPTCPQCRSSTNTKNVIRLYFNINSNDSISDDPATLWNKLTNLESDIITKDNELKKNKLKCFELETEVSLTRTQLKNYESKIDLYNTQIADLRDKIKFYKNKSKENENLVIVIDKLKSKIKQLEHVEKIMNANKDEISDMIKRNVNSETLSILTVTLKKSLSDSEKKIKDLDSYLKKVQNECRKYNKENVVLKETCDNLRKQLDEKNFNENINKEDISDICKSNNNNSVNNLRVLQTIKVEENLLLSDKKKEKFVKPNSPYTQIKVNSNISTIFNASQINPSNLYLGNDGLGGRRRGTFLKTKLFPVDRIKKKPY